MTFLVATVTLIAVSPYFIIFTRSSLYITLCAQLWLCAVSMPLLLLLLLPADNIYHIELAQLAGL